MGKIKWLKTKQENHSCFSIDGIISIQDKEYNIFIIHIRRSSIFDWLDIEIVLDKEIILSHRLPQCYDLHNHIEYENYFKTEIEKCKERCLKKIPKHIKRKIKIEKFFNND